MTRGRGMERGRVQRVGGRYEGEDDEGGGWWEGEMGGIIVVLTYFQS